MVQTKQTWVARFGNARLSVVQWSSSVPPTRFTRISAKCDYAKARQKAPEKNHTKGQGTAPYSTNPPKLLGSAAAAIA
jgi:hypothetical protein